MQTEYIYRSTLSRAGNAADTDPDRHRDLYAQLLDKFNVAGKDSACKDMARRNYLSYDPNIWMNPNPVTFHYIPTVRAQGKVIQPHAERKVSDKSIINIINSLWKKNNFGTLEFNVY